MREQLIESIIDQYSETLLRSAYYYTKNSKVAEDIVQDVFIKFYYDTNYIEQGQLKAYLVRMTINKCKDYLKSWSYKHLVWKDKIFGGSTRNDWHRQQEEQIIEQVILKLPIKLREPIVYFYFEEMKIKDIALLLEIPESTVKSRLTKGKNELKQMLSSIEWEALLYD